MENYTGNIYDMRIDEIFKSTNVDTKDDAFYLMVEQSKAAGVILPFTTLEEYWNYTAFLKRTFDNSNEAQKAEADKIRRLFRVKNYQAKKGFMDDFNNSKGAYPFLNSEGAVFDRLNGLRPGIFQSLKELNEFKEQFTEAYRADGC